MARPRSARPCPCPCPASPAGASCSAPYFRSGSHETKVTAIIDVLALDSPTSRREDVLLPGKRPTLATPCGTGRAPPCQGSHCLLACSHCHQAATDQRAWERQGGQRDPCRLSPKEVLGPLEAFRCHLGPAPGAGESPLGALPRPREQGRALISDILNMEGGDGEGGTMCGAGRPPGAVNYSRGAGGATGRTSVPRSGPGAPKTQTGPSRR